MKYLLRRYFTFLLTMVIGGESILAATGLELSKVLYEAKCSQCHGDGGDGQGVAKDFFNPVPRDFTSGAFKIRTTESGELPTREDLKKIIRLGMPYTGMPAWPQFSEEELGGLVEYVMSFNSDFSDAAYTTLKSVPIPKAPKYSVASAEIGRKIFVENKCADCHGEFGRSDGESAPTLKDDAGHAIPPADLTKPWTFRGGATREDIYRTFTTGLNGTPMPSFSNSIAEEDRWHLVDYLVSLAPSTSPNYGLVVVAEPVSKIMDLDSVGKQMKNIAATRFPVIGQVVDDPRCFYPGINAVEVKALYDSIDIVIQISWHDMFPHQVGKNSITSKDSLADSLLSDAIALQMPWNEIEGTELPYFLFGDKKSPVRIAYRDLAADSAVWFKGRGGNSMVGGERLESIAQYEKGEWRVCFKFPRKIEKGMQIEPDRFVPIAFSVWDGGSHESGLKRGITSWVSLALKPAGKSSPWIPATSRAGLILGMEFIVVLFLRRKFRT